MKTSSNALLPFILLFISISGILIAGKGWLLDHQLDYSILLIANGIFFATSVLAYLMQQKALNKENPNVYIRSVMAGMMIKMMLCIGAIAIYVLVNKGKVSKPTVFAAMGLYLIYLVIEVRKATRLNRR